MPSSLPAGFVPSPAMGTGIPSAAPSSDQGPTDGAGAGPSTGKDTPAKEESGLLTLPLTRIRRMVKEDEDVKNVAGDAAFVIARATELFIEQLAARTAAKVPAGSKKGVTYKEVSRAVAEYSACDFLADIVPQKLTAAELLQQMQQNGAASK